MSEYIAGGDNPEEGGVVVVTSKQIQVRGAAERPPTHRTVPQPRLIGSDVHSADVGKACPGRPLLQAAFHADGHVI